MRPPRISQGQDGHSFFVTTTTHLREKYFENPECARIAADMIHWYRGRGDFWLAEYVIMPDHLHLLFVPHRLPLSKCMQHLKRTVSQKIAEAGFDTVTSENETNKLWQSSFHDTLIRTPNQFAALRNYILWNPVHAGLVKRPEDYPFSSIHHDTDRHRIVTGLCFPDHQPPFVLATSNPGKVKEIREALHGIPFELLDLTDFGYLEDSPEETGSTFAENAAIKARFYHERTGLPTLAEDSGIIVEALRDALGIHTRRWGAGPKATDREWIEFFLQRMRREKNKRASFVCHIAHIDENGKLHSFKGKCEGVLTDELQAKYLPGLPISACFVPDGYDRVFSALSIEQKNSTSHRGRAIGKLKEFLQSTGRR